MSQALPYPAKRSCAPTPQARLQAGRLGKTPSESQDGSPSKSPVSPAALAAVGAAPFAGLPSGALPGSVAAAVAASADSGSGSAGEETTAEGTEPRHVSFAAGSLFANGLCRNSAGENILAYFNNGRRRANIQPSQHPSESTPRMGRRSLGTPRKTTLIPEALPDEVDVPQHGQQNEGWTPRSRKRMGFNASKPQPNPMTLPLENLRGKRMYATSKAELSEEMLATLTPTTSTSTASTMTPRTARRSFGEQRKTSLLPEALPDNVDIMSASAKVTKVWTADRGVRRTPDVLRQPSIPRSSSLDLGPRKRIYPDSYNSIAAATISYGAFARRGAADDESETKGIEIWPGSGAPRQLRGLQTSSPRTARQSTLTAPYATGTPTAALNARLSTPHKIVEAPYATDLQLQLSEPLNQALEDVPTASPARRGMRQIVDSQMPAGDHPKARIRYSSADVPRRLSLPPETPRVAIDWNSTVSAASLRPDGEDRLRARSLSIDRPRREPLMSSAFVERQRQTTPIRGGSTSVSRRFQTCTIMKNNAIGAGISGGSFEGSHEHLSNPMSSRDSAFPRLRASSLENRELEYGRSLGNSRRSSIGHTPSGKKKDLNTTLATTAMGSSMFSTLSSLDTSALDEAVNRRLSALRQEVQQLHAKSQTTEQHIRKLQEESNMLTNGTTTPRMSPTLTPHRCISPRAAASPPATPRAQATPAATPRTSMPPPLPASALLTP